MHHEGGRIWGGAVGRAERIAHFAQALHRERKRCERYNHFFSLMMVRSSDLAPEDLINHCSRCLRDTDSLGLLSISDGHGPGPKWMPADRANPAGVMVGIMLPETPRNPAEVARERLATELEITGRCLVGLATYPDDGVSVNSLIRQATDSGGKLW